MDRVKQLETIQKEALELFAKKIKIMVTHSQHME